MQQCDAKERKKKRKEGPSALNMPPYGWHPAGLSHLTPQDDGTEFSPQTLLFMCLAAK